MKRWILHIMLVGVLGMLAASCSQDVESPLDAEGKKVKVTFTLATGGQDAYSRTTWEGYDGDGNADANATSVYNGEAFDNKIDPDQLQVLICDADCKPIAKVERLLHTKVNNNTYKFNGTFEASIDDKTDYKIMVFANCPTITQKVPSASVVGPVVATTANLQAIPMWGVQQITGAALLAETNNITIHVLRALAKVEITISESVYNEGYTLVSASFNKYNEKINCIPNGFSSVTATTELATGNSVLSNGTTTNQPSFNPNSSEKEGLAFATIETDKKLVAYVPEYKNTDNKLTMTVTVKKGGTSKFYEVPFKYSDTAVRDVIRNYYYTYDIVGVNAAQPVDNLDLRYAVQILSEIDNGKLTFGSGTGATLTYKNNENGNNSTEEE